MTNAYEDTEEALQILVTERAKRYSQDFLEARDAAALALRDAVLKCAGEAGYFVGEVDGFHVIAPRAESEAAVALLANADGVRVATVQQKQLKDEAIAGLQYDAFRDAWLPQSKGKSPAAKVEGDTAAPSSTAPGGPAPSGQPKAERSPVAVVADLVVAALQKIP